MSDRPRPFTYYYMDEVRRYLGELMDVDSCEVQRQLVGDTSTEPELHVLRAECENPTPARALLTESFPVRPFASTTTGEKQREKSRWLRHTKHGRSVPLPF